MSKGFQSYAYAAFALIGADVALMPDRSLSVFTYRQCYMRDGYSLANHPDVRDLHDDSVTVSPNRSQQKLCCFKSST